MKTKTKVTKYGLMKDGKLLSFYSNSNQGSDCCNERSYSLTESSNSEDKLFDMNNYWLVDDEITAEYVRNHSTEWYNADYETPINQFIDEKERIIVMKVEVEMEIDIEPVSISLPTPKELIKSKYQKSEPKHYKYLSDLINDGEEIKFDILDYKKYFKNKVWKKLGYIK